MAGKIYVINGMQQQFLGVFFAHHDEPLPDTVTLNYPTPPPRATSSARQQKKWQSQRMAFFLLHKIFEQYQLDTTHLQQIQRTPSGRPYLADPRIDFNISHSGDWVAIIFSLSTPTKMVGIDIEHPQKIRRYADLLRYYAKPKEIAEIENGQVLPQLDSLEKRFYLSWCLREAVLKSQGVGIVKLSEVQHSLSEQRIYSAHCPQGTLCFYHQLPFYLAYFFEQEGTVLSLPSLSQWQNGRFVPVHTSVPIIYQVNPCN
ncbi:MAG: 4'-phosphopantetheinyl transferase superfamily protein [Pasteurellaceae bacterium]|nr:4'-phosphopantetheinyl transferase superfamily protein [Pasteurellaceae bacterium]